MRRVSPWKASVGLGVGAGVLALVLWGCFRQSAPPASAAPGTLFAAQTSFDFVVFLPPQAVAPTPAKLGELVGQRFQSLRWVGEGRPTEPPPTVRVTEHTTREFPLPEGEMLELAVRHLSPQEQSGLAASERILLLQFTTVPPGLEAVRQAHELALELARTTGGLLWDEESGEFFSIDKWQEFRLAEWEGGEPRLARHFNSRLYTEGDGTARFVTVGMRKFGLPDLEVRHVPETLTGKVGTLINIVAQLMIEGTAVREDGTFPVALNALKLASMRERLLQQVQDGARAGVVLNLVPADPKQADRDNRLLEIRFPSEPGDSPSERPYAAITALFGGKDEIVSAPHDDALLEASSRAREELLTRLKPRFLEGLRSGERLFVKAPFDTSSGGTEWMWVHVITWEGSTIQGVLDSQPDEVPGLKAGSKVTVEEGSLFDYLLVSQDGTFEGNQTERLLIERSRQGGRGGSR
ncbi:DUF2314 domain-containing protein [Hyalangium rubrum]|uniref:DUF2314 domain-containing protein n=1 Tax=Hyalangium rubrum TaxID=3103134 RepID=A0ABU5H7Q5_9BACT|nr:DUF2314 domain-containing protein [Hyalangium sp. s54d21]MDY7229504.1 DUF2314 domain-containing protein [Hyalangium sp. s54d21]